MRDCGAAEEGAFAGRAQGKSTASGAGGDASRGADIFCEATGRNTGRKSGAGLFGRSRARSGCYVAVWDWVCAERRRFAVAAFSRKVSGENASRIRADFAGPERAAF